MRPQSDPRAAKSKATKLDLLDCCRDFHSIVVHVRVFDLCPNWLTFSLLVLALVGCNGPPSAAPTDRTPNSTTTAPDSISGTVRPASGGSGAIATMSGPVSGSTIRDASGNYGTGLADGTYTVAPNNRNLAFAPPNQSVTVVNGGSATAVNFTVSATSAGFTISGTISSASAGAGTTVTLSGGANLSTTANGAGVYIFSGLSAGSYTVTPNSQIATLAPASQNVTVIGSSVSGVDFTATATANIVFFDNFAGTTLASGWTVISRHGEYAQNETECNIAREVAVADGLTITTAAQSASCGDFKVDGSERPRYFDLR